MLLGFSFSLSDWWLLSIPVYSFCLDYGLTFCSWCQMVTFKSLSLLLLGRDGRGYSTDLSSWNICWADKTIRISCLSGWLSDKRLWLGGLVSMRDKCFYLPDYFRTIFLKIISLSFFFSPTCTWRRRKQKSSATTAYCNGHFASDWQQWLSWLTNVGLETACITPGTEKHLEKKIQDFCDAGDTNGRGCVRRR